MVHSAPDTRNIILAHRTTSTSQPTGKGYSTRGRVDVVRSSLCDPILYAWGFIEPSSLGMIWSMRVYLHFFKTQ